MTAPDTLGSTALGYTDIGQAIGVSGRQVHAWHTRRARNGFPEACGTKPWGQREVPVFDLAEVRAWKASYVPSKGGAPLGNTNNKSWARQTRP